MPPDASLSMNSLKIEVWRRSVVMVGPSFLQGRSGVGRRAAGALREDIRRRSTRTTAESGWCCTIDLELPHDHAAGGVARAERADDAEAARRQVVGILVERDDRARRRGVGVFLQHVRLLLARCL